MLNKVVKTQIIQTLEKAIANNELAGGSILAIHKGQPLFYHESGYANRENNIPFTRDTMVRMYSLTKPVMATCTMIAVEQGIIDLFDPVDKFLPGFKDQKVAIGNELVPAKRSVNLMDLMNMTSGLLYGGDNLAGLHTNQMWMDLDSRLFSDNPMTTLEAMNQLGKGPLAFQPGEAWEYGTSADVLGAVIEVASGMKLSDFMHQYLFAPLKMVDTGFFVPDDKLHRLATTYERTAEGELIPYTGNNLGIINAMDRPPAFESGGAGLVSTIDDYGRFAQMLLNKGTLENVQILRKKSVDYLINHRLTPRQESCFEGWHTLAGHSYGNLMRVVTDTHKTGIISTKGEYGWDGWLGAYLANSPKDELTFLVMMQQKDAGTTTVTRKLRNIVMSSLG